MNFCFTLNDMKPIPFPLGPRHKQGNLPYGMEKGEKAHNSLLQFPKVISIIYHTASKGEIHKREPARRASRLSQLLNKALKQAQN